MFVFLTLMSFYVKFLTVSSHGTKSNNKIQYN